MLVQTLFQPLGVIQHTNTYSFGSLTVNPIYNNFYVPTGSMLNK